MYNELQTAKLILVPIVTLKFQIMPLLILKLIETVYVQCNECMVIKSMRQFIIPFVLMSQN